ncbi:GAF domain-containing sensor histidine kinase [Ideonella sp. BN130291]|uniref:GAF domain-containing sensor histidine kinase n=1 Tax=Ideonella sp. BN130291 TaxID=3112940 RepID=UPI002E261417|nr:GAF domain-containing sensor histidine kinase [Ideonella sp. BN130291]
MTAYRSARPPTDRQGLLEALGVRNASAEACFESLVAMAAHALGAPTALLSFLDAETVWVKACVGWDDERSYGADGSFCQFVVRSGQALWVDDVSRESPWSGSHLVQSHPWIRAYAGVPIEFAGATVGALSVMSPAVGVFCRQDEPSLLRLATVVKGLLNARIAQWLRQQEAQRSMEFARISGDWLWETDAQGHYEWLWGASFERKTGLAPERLEGQPVLGGPIVDWLGAPVEPPDTFEAVLHRQETFSALLVQVDVSGHRLIVARAGEPHHGADGRFLGYRGSSRDVTAQIELNRQLALANQLREVAEQTTRASNRFMSQVSHELRTPLNAILGFTQLMVVDHESGMAPRQIERMNHVHDAASRLLSLINDMLDLGRAQEGRLVLGTRDVAVASALKSALALVETAAAGRNIAVTVDAPDGLCVQADPRALDQVLLNLLSNGVKYNVDGGRLTIHARRVDGHVAIAVQDTGMGLTEAELGQLFQPFNRLGAGKGGTPGTGLGLVICQALLLSMKGQIDVKSCPGEGTVVTIRLPGCAAPAALVEAGVPAAGP